MVKSLKELVDMSQIGGRHSWRLRSLSEEEELAAQSDMLEAASSFDKALSSLKEGDRESAVAALRRAIVRATSAIEKISQ